MSSLTRIVEVKFPAVSGTPVILPFEVSIERPGGRPVALKVSGSFSGSDALEVSSSQPEDAR